MVWTNDMTRQLDRYMGAIAQIKRGLADVPTAEMEDRVVIHESMRNPVQVIYEAVFGESKEIVAYRSVLEERAGQD